MRGSCVGQALEEPADLAPVPFGDTAHHEDGGGGQADVPGGERGQLERRHLGVLHFAELVLQHRQLRARSVRSGPPYTSLLNSRA